VLFAHLGFWVHSTLVLVFANLLPHSKHFHIITAIPNVFTRDINPPGRLPLLAPNAEAIGELVMKAEAGGAREGDEPVGVARIEHFTWKAILDFYTCTECGRCSDNCPAHKTGKMLSPKQLTLNLRDHLYSREHELLNRPGGPKGASTTATRTTTITRTATSTARVTRTRRSRRTTITATVTTITSDGPRRSRPPRARLSRQPDPDPRRRHRAGGSRAERDPPRRALGLHDVPRLRGAVPGDDQLRRQDREHAPQPRPREGRVPGRARERLPGDRGERQPVEPRAHRSRQLGRGPGRPDDGEHPTAEVLYWVGCAASYDDRAKKIARSTAKLIKAAGVDFAILGQEETCTGDPARRAGNEYLFAMLAEQNAATLNGYKEQGGAKKILTTCPHCFNTLKNEYPDFGAKFEVVHHTDYLLGLVAEKKLVPRKKVEGKVVFHDSCYLGRYNGIYDHPRDILKAIPGVVLVEAEGWSREKGLCCGAGGAQMWMEEQNKDRVNVKRTLQLLQTEAKTIATGCPFCQTMITDGLKAHGKEEEIRQLDVVELLEESCALDKPWGVRAAMPQDPPRAAPAAREAVPSAE
jgi:Fe-S oxidoreductase